MGKQRTIAYFAGIVKPFTSFFEKNSPDFLMKSAFFDFLAIPFRIHTQI